MGGYPTKRATIVTMIVSVACALTLSALTAAVAAEASSGWSEPVTKGYGKAYALPNSAYQPDNSIDYKVIFDITKPLPKGGVVTPGFEHLARFMNLLAISGLDPKETAIVGMVHGAALDAVLTNEAYRKKFNKDNPNLKLIGQLKAAGAHLYVCGQSLARKGYPKEWVNPDIEVALSAMTTLAICQLRGYALMTQ